MKLELCEKRKAVIAQGGHLLVLGGPGSGKTTIALLKAQRMQEKAARVGFEWENIGQVLDKVEEEVGELREALAAGDEVHAAEELGDLVFALANVARHLKVDAEDTVRLTCEKFRARFGAVEARAHQQGREVRDMTLGEMMAVWDEAKDAAG